MRSQVSEVVVRHSVDMQHSQLFDKILEANLERKFVMNILIRFGSC